MALGGWNDSTKRKYSELLADPGKIARFVEHSVKFVQEYGFDGLDLDYEYPNYDGHGHDAPESDRRGFTELCQKLSEAPVSPEGNPAVELKGDQQPEALGDAADSERRQGHRLPRSGRRRGQIQTP